MATTKPANVIFEPVTYIEARYKISSLRTGERVLLKFTDLEHKDEVFQGEAIVVKVEDGVATFDEIMADGRGTSPTQACKDKWGQWISSGRLYTQVVGKAA